MRITLMHNPNAGHASPSDDELIAAIRAAGHKVDYQSVKKKKWKEALEEPGGMVVAAGGDGTVAKVAVELAGRGIPIAIIPVGTANNIARSLGVHGAVDELVAGWGDARRRKFDIGVASGPWGETRFLEAVGGGLFAQAMAVVETQEELASPAGRAEELDRDLGLLELTLEATRARSFRLTVDGRDLSGDYILFEVMNLPFIGPNVCLAPDASPGDGRFDVVLLAEGHRDRFAEYLNRLRRGDTTAPELPVVHGRRVQLRWDGVPIHVDSDCFADAAMGDDDAGAIVDIWLDSEVEVLVGGG